MTSSILLVEDNAELQESLKLYLQAEGYIVQTAGTGGKAIQLLEKRAPDMVILDLGLPDIQGEAVCYQIRKQYKDVYIIILTARSSTEDVIKGLSLGADDYIAKPFNTEELVARIKAVLRRTHSADELLRCGDLELNPKTLEVIRGGKEISLTHTEFKLLHYLLINKERVVTREMILNHVWTYNLDIESRVVDVYIGYLRKKIDDGQKKKLLHSRRGFGYRLTDE
ncbi:MAG: response regulator transcription factor [Weeksellaceae bacterium]